MNIFIIQGKSGIYPGIWMSRAKAEADREMVPASELREREELVQKLADVAFEYEAAHVGEERAESNFVVAHRLRKIDGKWERCK